MSKQQVLTAIKHAELADKHAKKLEALGEKLKQYPNAGPSGELIQKYAKAAQQHAKASLSHAIAAQKQDASSKEEYIKAVLEHQKQSDLCVKAMKEYVKLIKDKISFWQEFY